MRIGAGGLEHETNTFSNIPVTAEVLAKALRTGDEVNAQYRGVRCMAGGFIDECEARGIDLAWASYADLTPCGPTVKAVFERFRDNFVEQMWTLHQEEPLDAIALNIHGAGVAEGYPDLEAELLRALRARFGNGIPIGMVLDLHGNITPEMMCLSDITVGYKCYPHTDTYESARRLISLLDEKVRGGKPLTQALVRLPWHLAPAGGVTLDGPLADVQKYFAKLTEEEPLLRDITLFHGFPYADVPFSGVSVTAVAETREAAEHFAHKAAAYAWSRRKDLDIPIYSAEAAMDLAERAEAPVVINEASDNPGGGTPGDGTFLLREMLKRNIPGSAFGFISDAEVARQAAEAGEGSTIRCLLGAKSDKLHGTPIEVEKAYVKRVVNGEFIKKNPMGAGARVRMGTTVLLEVGNVEIVVSGARFQTLDDGPFLAVGIDWREKRILALKSTQHFKGWWCGRAKTIIPCNSPGIHSADLESFEYHFLNKDYYPFKDAVWEDGN